MRAHLFNDFENVRAVENAFSQRAERLNEVLENQHRGHVEAGERLVQDEDIGIVHKSGNEEDALTHPFGVRHQRNVAMRKKREKLKE